MKNICHLFAGLVLALFAVVAQAQGLSPQQITTVRAAIFATPAAAAQLAAGNVAGVQAWANGSTATKGWLTAAPIGAMDEAPSYTAYDSMVQGKRDSWVRFLAYPRNCARNRVRNWVVDVWGNATASSNAEAVLLACTEAATAAQVAIGGTNRTTGTASALADIVIDSGDFTKANGDTSGRKITIGAQSSVLIDASGTATHIALVITGSSTLLYGTTCTSQALTANGSNTVNFPAWDIEFADPA